MKCRGRSHLSERVIEEWMGQEERYRLCDIASPHIGLVEENDEACASYEANNLKHTYED